MKTKRILFLIGVVALSLTGTVASAATRASPMMTRSAMTRPAPRFAPRTMTGTHRFFNDRFHNQNTFVFVDTFGFPFFYPFAYYGYYPYGYGYDGYYGYNDYAYGGASRVVDVQRRLARAGYYHG